MKKLISKISNIVGKGSAKFDQANSRHKKKIISRKQHNLSRQFISDNALKVLYRLHNAGFEAHIVGGGVRDILLGREPKDFDVVTDANPEEVKRLFRNCRLIGRRFRLAHVYFKSEIIEVATFRADNESHRDSRVSSHGVILRDNVYGSMDEDIWRRDFTVNALYYNIADFSVIDYSTGLKDLEKGIIRIMGNPKERFREDPVRILRAIRFAAKLGFTIHPKTLAPIPTSHELLSHISNARLFDESLKLFFAGYSQETFALLHRHDLLQYIFPLTDDYLKRHHQPSEASQFIATVLESTDERISTGKTVNPAFLYAAMLWYPLNEVCDQLQQGRMHVATAFDKAMQKVLSTQAQQTAIPKRLVSTMREIWEMQHLLIRRDKHRVNKLFYNPRFRAAYDFLLVRSETEPECKEAAHWWTTFVDSDEEQRHELVTQLKNKKRRRRR